jgi:hypothetical protein
MSKIDFIPVDRVANNVIVAAWQTAINRYYNGYLMTVSYGMNFNPLIIISHLLGANVNKGFSEYLWFSV